MRIRKCDLCGRLVSKRIKIVNRINGNELNICSKCMKEWGFKHE